MDFLEQGILIMMRGARSRHRAAESKIGLREKATQGNSSGRPKKKNREQRKWHN
jgi:hypothetical protein